MAYSNENAVPIRDDIYWIGGDDRTASIFEGAFPIPEGVSYNSYLIRDEKTCLLDSCDASIAAKFWRNLRTALDGRDLDYFVVNHMEPDHGACITQVLETWPDVTVIGNSKTFDMMENFYHIRPKNVIEVKEGDEISTGKHTLRFVFAVMVHWPEVMFTYDVTERILFSADASGRSRPCPAPCTPTRPTSTGSTWTRPGDTTPTSSASTAARSRPSSRSSRACPWT